MTLQEDRPSIPERYATAIDANDLTVAQNPEERGPVDLLVSAGWCRDGLGTLLYRLRAEFDTVRGEHRAALRSLHAIDETRRELLLRAEREANPHAAERLRQQAQAVSDMAAMDAMSNRLLIMGNLKMLPDGRRAVRGFVAMLAARNGVEIDAAQAVDLSANLLSAWLDPICPHCCGRGFNGGWSAPMVMCHGPGRCGGTGRRSPRLASSEGLHKLGLLALAQMDRKTEIVTQQMRRFLRTRNA